MKYLLESVMNFINGSIDSDYTMEPMYFVVSIDTGQTGFYEDSNNDNKSISISNDPRSFERLGMHHRISVYSSLILIINLSSYF